MADPAGEADRGALRLDFDRRLMLRFRGSVITCDGGLLAYRELDDALALTASGGERLAEARTGRNRRHLLVGLLRQSVFGRLAGYEDVNDAERLCRDPAMRWVVGGGAPMGRAASASQMGRFETEWLTRPVNLPALADLLGQWIDAVHQRRQPRVVVLDMDSSESPTYGEQEGSTYNGHFGYTCAAHAVRDLPLLKTPEGTILVSQRSGIRGMSVKSSLQRSLCATVFAAAVASAPIAAHAMGDEEFVGPFVNWANVQTTYGATGNGVADDTVAIQKALNALSPTNPTIYFPPGTYRITRTLTLTGQQYVNVIGADPATTRIIWGGAFGGTMLNLNGNVLSRFSRLTFNGQGTAAVDVDQSWDGSTGYFDTGNEYADDVFENAGTGFSCGSLNYGCAETSMLRDQFINDSVIGVAMWNFNALDMFIWYSLFRNDGVGAGNVALVGSTYYAWAGEFHVFNSVFENSATADISIGNTGYFNFRNNYSIGSNQFIGPSWGTANPANITVEGNTILDTTNPVSIGVGNLGPVILLDNTIRSLAGVTSGPVVRVANWQPSDLFSMGNIFTVSSPTYSNGHYHSVQDQIVARSTVNPSMPILPGTPPNNHRRIFEVAPGSSAAQIQQAINAAAASGTQKPVVHIEPGNYSINTTLVVPAGSDVQIIGDGYYSQLTWTGTTTGPVMQLAGPSKATLRDFSVSGNNRAGNGIEVDDVDQPGSSVFMEQAFLAGSQTDLFVDALDNTNVQLQDFYHQGSLQIGDTAVNVTGGPSAAAGNWQGGATNIFAGASYGENLSYAVSNGAHVGIRDIFYDGGAGGGQMAVITGASTFTYAGSLLALGGSSAISFDNFQGTAALLNLEMWGGVDITGNGSGAQVLGLGLVGYSAGIGERNEYGGTTYDPYIASGTQSPPANGATSATLTFTMPTTPGLYQWRFWPNNGYGPNSQPLATSGVITVTGAAVSDGACGAAVGIPVNRAPTLNLCTSGTASAVSGGGPWSWSCAGSNSIVQCSAPVAAAATPTIIASPASVGPGGLQTVTIQNGPGNPLDWVALYAVSEGFFVNNSSPAASTEFLNGQTGFNPPSDAATSELFEPVPPDPSFLTATLNQIRTEQPTLLTPLPSGVTDVRFYRVLVESAITGVHLEAASATAVVLPPSEVAATASGLAYSRVSHTFNGIVTISNISSGPLSGPFEILFTGLTAGVTLVNPTGDFSGSPYLTVPGTASLASGQSATVSVQFANPSFGTINFTPVIYSGSL